MSIFICAKCGCEENTALGCYWGRVCSKDQLFDDSDVGVGFEGKPLCSECAPTKYIDGTLTRFNHTWHNKFPKVYPNENKI